MKICTEKAKEPKFIRPIQAIVGEVYLGRYSGAPHIIDASHRAINLANGGIIDPHARAWFHPLPVKCCLKIEE